jgi:hypothetical protein
MRSALLAVVAMLGAGCGRGGFDPYVPGIADVDGIAGTLVSTPGALVVEDGRYDLAPTLDGEGYAIAWMEYASGDRTPRVMFAVASQDAELIVPPRPIEFLVEATDLVRLIAGPSGYLLVHRTPSSGTVYTAIDAAGIVTARRENGGPYSTAVAIATGFVVAYHSTVADLGQVHTVVLDASGSPIGPSTPVETTTTDQYYPALARSGGELGLVWVDYRNGGSPRIRYARLDATGAAVGPSVQIYDDGQTQYQPYLASDGGTGFVLAHDRYSTFPVYLVRFGLDGVPIWPQPAVLYDERRYHDTLDVATSASTTGSGGFAWITEEETLLTNVQFATVVVGSPTTPPTPDPILLTDPRYSFCYPELARASASFGTAFAGEVEGSLGLFLVVVPD